MIQAKLLNNLKIRNGEYCICFYDQDKSLKLEETRKVLGQIEHSKKKLGK